MHNFSGNTSSNKAGFTLIEILVAISIIAVVFGVVITSAASVQKQARDGQRKADLNKLKGALQQYYTDVGFFPSSDSIGVREMSLGTLNVLTNCGGRLNPCPPVPETPKTYLNPIPLEPMPVDADANGVADNHYCYQAWNDRSMAPNPSDCDNSVGAQCHYYRIYVRLENPPGPTSTCIDPSGAHAGQNYFIDPDSIF